MLLASDREESAARLRTLLPPSVVTHVLVAPRAIAEAHDPHERAEHGVHTGTSAMRDVYLLSLADHLIGTQGSSFSTAAAALLASRPEAEVGGGGTTAQAERSYVECGACFGSSPTGGLTQECGPVRLLITITSSRSVRSS